MLAGANLGRSINILPQSSHAIPDASKSITKVFLHLFYYDLIREDHQLGKSLMTNDDQPSKDLQDGTFPSQHLGVNMLK